MLLWNGACHVHEQFSVEKIVELKKQYPNAHVLAHPECKSTILALADKVGSTAALLKYAIQSDIKEFIVATESGILHEMRAKCPSAVFHAVQPEVIEGGKSCVCNECEYMKMNTLLKIYNSLKHEWPVIEVEKDIAQDAVKCINRMLEMS